MTGHRRGDGKRLSRKVVTSLKRLKSNGGVQSLLMVYLADLSGSGNQRYVGFLSFVHPYPRGEVLPACFERLVALTLAKPLLVSAGYHSCDLGRCGIKQALSIRLQFREAPHILFRHPACTYKESHRRTEVGGAGGRLLGSHNIYIPGDKFIYCAPSLILHYILDHRYRPPEEFSEAVLKCPSPRSPEYRQGIKRLSPTGPWAQIMDEPQAG